MVSKIVTVTVTRPLAGDKQRLMRHFWLRKVDPVLMWRSGDGIDRFICSSNSAMFVSAYEHWCLLAHNFAHAHAWHPRVFCRYSVVFVCWLHVYSIQRIHRFDNVKSNCVSTNITCKQLQIQRENCVENDASKPIKLVNKCD